MRIKSSVNPAVLSKFTEFLVLVFVLKDPNGVTLGLTKSEEFL